jgi:hypothetical protein
VKKKARKPAAASAGPRGAGARKSSGGHKSAAAGASALLLLLLPPVGLLTLQHLFCSKAGASGPAVALPPPPPLSGDVVDDDGLDVVQLVRPPSRGSSPVFPSLSGWPEPARAGLPPEPPGGEVCGGGRGAVQAPARDSRVKGGTRAYSVAPLPSVCPNTSRALTHRASVDTSSTWTSSSVASCDASSSATIRTARPLRAQT